MVHDQQSCCYIKNMKQARNETLYYASEVELRRKSIRIKVDSLKLLLNLPVLDCPIDWIVIQVSEGADSLVNIRVDRVNWARTCLRRLLFYLHLGLQRKLSNAAFYLFLFWKFWKVLEALELFQTGLTLIDQEKSNCSPALKPSTAVLLILPLLSATLLLLHNSAWIALKGKLSKVLI